MKKVTETVFSVYSEKYQLFWGVDHCHYQNPDDIAVFSRLTTAEVNLELAKEYYNDFDWKIVKIEKSWEILDESRLETSRSNG